MASVSSVCKEQNEGRSTVSFSNPMGRDLLDFCISQMASISSAFEQRIEIISPGSSGLSSARNFLKIRPPHFHIGHLVALGLTEGHAAEGRNSDASHMGLCSLQNPYRTQI